MIRRHHLARSGTARRGTTLVEVLLSLLLMGIGLVTLATLFPASIIRTVRAHQLTTSTILRFNAETTRQMYADYFIEWDDTTNYPALQPSLGNTAYVVVDPLGYKRTTGVPADFGDFTRFTFDNTVDAPDIDGNGTAGEDADAVLMTMLPDSWEVVYDATVTGFSDLDVQIDRDEVIDDGITLGTTFPAPIMYRVTLFSDTGRGAQYRMIDAFDDSTKTISWVDSISSITSGNFAPERVRVEVSNPKFSWMMTVRRNYVDDTQVNNNVDVAVFFKRSFRPDAETVYAGSTLTLGSTEAVINATNLEPAPKNGNFLFDAEKCNWYRIVSVDEDNPTRVTIERPAVQSTTKLMLVRDVIDVYPLKSFTTTLY